MRSRTAEIARGVTALTTATATVMAPPVALVRFVGNPLPAGVPSWREFTDALTRSGVSDEVVIGVLAVLGWVIWAELALAILGEAAALGRGRSVRRLPGVIPGVQTLAAHWLAAAALIAGPITASTDASPVPVLSLAVAADTAVPVAPETDPQQREEVPAAASRPSAPATESAPAEYLVQKHDSLWEIAERILGDPYRWQEIRDLNVGRPQPDGRALGPGSDLIHPGWRLIVPTTTPAVTTARPDEHVVQPGEHLWSVAEQVALADLGRPATDDEVRTYWQRLIEDNRDELIEPGNPSLVIPGQRLELPGRDEPVPVAVPAEPPPAAPLPAPEAAEPEVAVAADGSHGEVVVTTAAQRPAPPTVDEATDPLADEEEGDSDASPVVPLLGAAGTALATGILTTWRRRQRRQSARAPHGHAPPALPAASATLQAEVATVADTDATGDLRRAFAELASHIATTGAVRSRRPRLAQVTDGRVEVLLDQPALPVPSGWHAEASGAVWTRDRPVQSASDNLVSPALVTIGSDGPTDFLLELETAGMITLGGDPAGIEALLRSIVLELGHGAPDSVAVALVGDFGHIASSDDVRKAGWADIEADVLSWGKQSRDLLAANHLPTTFAARGTSRPLDGTTPLLVVCDSIPDGEGFGEAVSLATGGAALALVAIGGPIAGGLHLRIEQGTLTIDSLGLRCDAQALGEGADADVVNLVDSADRPAEPLALFGHDAIDLRSNGYVDPPHDVLVKVLGEIGVVGGNQPLRPKEIAVLTYVALHESCSVDRLEDAVWPVPLDTRRRQVHNIASRLRTKLGSEQFPLSADGKYAVGPRVQTDLDLLCRRAIYAESRPASEAIDVLRGALQLVDGRPFRYRNTDRGSFAWVDLEHWTATTEARVVEVAWRMWRVCTDEGDIDGAIWAARRGLLASPTNTELTEALMRAYAAAGDHQAAEDVFISHAKALDELDGDEPEPSVLELWDELRGPRTQQHAPRS